MKEEFVTDAEIRQFLLGRVDDSERQRIESLFMSDAEFNQRVIIAEDDLIEDYLENSLARTDRDKFLAQYGNMPEERRKLGITRAIKEYAVAEAMMSKAAISTNPKWRTFISTMRLPNPRFLIPVAGILALAFVVALVWLVKFSGRRAQENDRRVAIERQLAGLNDPSSLREVPPQTYSLVLPPVSVRSVGPQTQLLSETDNQVVELQLLWIQKEQYPSYRAVLRRVGNTDQFTISNLHVEKNFGGSAVRLRLPASLLTRGLYQVSLIGIGNDDAQGQSEEYSFTVGG